MNHLDEKAEHFAKSAFAQNPPRPKNPNKPTKKTQQGVQNVCGKMYMAGHSCKVDSICGLSWSRNTKYSDKATLLCIYLLMLTKLVNV